MSILSKAKWKFDRSKSSLYKNQQSGQQCTNRHYSQMFFIEIVKVCWIVNILQQRFIYLILTMQRKYSYSWKCMQPKDTENGIGSDVVKQVQIHSMHVRFTFNAFGIGINLILTYFVFFFFRAAVLLILLITVWMRSSLSQLWKLSGLTIWWMLAKYLQIPTKTLNFSGSF